MDKKNCLHFGEVRKTHGYRGELVVRVHVPSGFDLIEPGKPVLLDIEGGLVPFFLNAVEEREAGTLLIGLDGIDTEEKARDLMGLQIYLTEPPAGKTRSAKSDLHLLEGYRIIDSKKGLLGTVTGLEEYPMQTLFRVRQDKQEILVPVHEDLILSIDPGKKEILMDLPEGIEEL